MGTPLLRPWNRVGRSCLGSWTIMPRQHLPGQWLDRPILTGVWPSLPREATFPGSAACALGARVDLGWG